jgi:hypothetical protein
MKNFMLVFVLAVTITSVVCTGATVNKISHAPPPTIKKALNVEQINTIPTGTMCENVCYLNTGEYVSPPVSNQAIVNNSSQVMPAASTMDMFNISTNVSSNSTTKDVATTGRTEKKPLTTIVNCIALNNTKSGTADDQTRGTNHFRVLKTEKVNGLLIG